MVAEVTILDRQGYGMGRHRLASAQENSGSSQQITLRANLARKVIYRRPSQRGPVGTGLTQVFLRVATGSDTGIGSRRLYLEP
jgi:hypothetical protein